ncbi:MAG: hypothetical protein HQK84_02275 [Nitrospinae bacterium]|nr:hypothetical protein [Nitrospinota bacterium]
MKISDKLLDYLIAMMAGVATYLLVLVVVGQSWNMFVAMIVGMVLGMVVLGILILTFCRVIPAFEIMPGGMVITMFVGMATGMSEAMGIVCSLTLFISVVVFSLLVQMRMHLYNHQHKGEVSGG